ncbi:twin-arginine translocase TatA/TatE family subunit [Arthrobacter sp. H14]|uniref:twin-arginine translocase TatA/TatE family subunit n=1 Tax=Arthrobacter sp. H14 TaxID=1312959 RepID=UPI0004BBCCDF|nr:twin-arginine translocase TatA/TatE family subunit [Arthrobacter sp. H14]
MFGINGLEFIVIALIALLVLGPERLPDYAAQLGQLVKGLRRMAGGARNQLRDEMGPEFDDIDWRKLDPRQYDPRTIIKQALLDDDAGEVRKPTNQSPHDPAPSPQTPPTPTASTTSVTAPGEADNMPPPTS